MPLGSVASPEDVFARVYRRLGLKWPVPDFQVEYCAFSGLRSTIRLKDGCVQVRISDLLVEAPPLVLEALAEILVGRIYRRRPSREARACYLAYVLGSAMRRRVDAARRRRGRTRLLPPQGRWYDLEEIFEKLRRRFFDGRLSPARLGWSVNRSRAILGHYDSAHRTITVSRWLDSPRVPRYLVEYLVFHEMLHMRHPVERNGPRRVIHSRQFLEAEKKFPMYEQARRRLKLICP